MDLSWEKKDVHVDGKHHKCYQVCLACCEPQVGKTWPVSWMQKKFSASSINGFFNSINMQPVESYNIFVDMHESQIS